MCLQNCNTIVQQRNFELIKFQTWHNCKMNQFQTGIDSKQTTMHVTIKRKWHSTEMDQHQTGQNATPQSNANEMDQHQTSQNATLQSNTNDAIRKPQTCKHKYFEITITNTSQSQTPQKQKSRWNLIDNPNISLLNTSTISEQSQQQSHHSKIEISGSMYNTHHSKDKMIFESTSTHNRNKHQTFL